VVVVVVVVVGASVVDVVESGTDVDDVEGWSSASPASSASTVLAEPGAMSVLDVESIDVVEHALSITSTPTHMVAKCARPLSVPMP